MELERAIKKRTVIRTAVTKLVNEIEDNLKEAVIDSNLIEESLNTLTAKAENLKEIDIVVEENSKIEDLELEIVSAEEYSDKIRLAIFRAQKKLKESTTPGVRRNEELSAANEHNRQNMSVKLPKLNIAKYYGDYTQFTNFWNTFKVSIHDNECLSKTEKMSYLFNLVGGSAFSAIQGFSISDENYDAAIKILENRFGKKDIIINTHMNNLLNLTPVYKASDTFKLKKLHDDVETNVRSLNSLGVEAQSYGTMLINVILKNLPNELTLEYNRKHSENSSSSDIHTLLEFIQTEIQSRERSYSVGSNPQSKTASPFEKTKNTAARKNVYANASKQGSGTTSSIAEFMTAPVSDDSRRAKCLFCQSIGHDSHLCRSLTLEERRNILKAQNLCFSCLRRHPVKFCRSNYRCPICKNGKHSQAICFKFHAPEKKNNIDQSEPNKEKQDIVAAVSHSIENRIYLQTCCARIKTQSDESLIRVILDCGSMRSFITQEIADKLKLEPIRKENLSVYTFGSKSPIEKTYDVVNIHLKHRYLSEQKIEIEVLVTDHISGANLPPPEIEEVSKNKQFENLILADVPECQEPISLLIGADYYYNVVTGNIKYLSKNLVAVETILGWCLQGRKSDNHVLLTLNVIVEEKVISEQISKFWNLENSGLINEKQDSDPLEHEVMKQFESDIKYEKNRYEVKLPWKHDTVNLDNNREIAEQRFSRLKRRFQRNPDLFIEYREVLQDYLKQGIIELVPNSENEENIRTFYLPHREVIREDRTTSRLRIVFDASSHAPNSPSLNDCLHVGPNLYPDIFQILLRFRLNPVAFTIDMKQAFLQIMVNEQDRNVCRFYFTEDPTDDSLAPLIYRFTRVLFGVNSSPFLLAATIKYHLKRYFEKYRTTVEFLNENVYVDDVIGSQQSVEQALKTTLETIHIFKEASMHLHKFRTNSKELHELWEKEGLVAGNFVEIFGEENFPFKVLGMAWDNSKDLLYFDIQNLILFISRRVDTKRFLLQVLGRIFDPIGFLGPFTLKIKCLMQKVWTLGLDWDETLPEDLSQLWKNWCEEVPKLKQFSIPRYYFVDTPDSDFKSLELHCFSDASTKAYGTVAYLRVITHGKQIQTVFVASKNRVAPLKTLTLPKLELMGALLSAKLSDNILKALKIKIPCFFWTDSKIAYFWIKGSPEKFKPFVKNRIEDIRKLTSPSNWFHCPGTENPADLVSRGINISKLINNPVWLRGPEWLQQSPESWPNLNNEETLDDYDLQYRKKFDSILQSECVITEGTVIDISKFSDLEKLIRTTAWVKRFIMRLKKSTDVRGTLTADEVQEAERYLIRIEQKKYFEEELRQLKEGQTVKKNSPLVSFLPFLDVHGIMRIGGRLEFSDLSEDEKHPIVLAKGSYLTSLIVSQEHEKVMHGGTAATLAKVRSRFWILRGRQLVKSVVKKCLICRKYLAKPIDQMTAPLPRDRISETPPFSVCGIDFAGPVYVKNFKEIQKSYIVLITCAVTRALHLELVSDMSTDSFLLAFRRFLARRGNCKIIYSDNAKTFKKAKKEIENLSNILTDNLFQNFVTKERIVWKNIIERAAWWGGFYERLVKSVKECVRKITGKALLTYDEMSTLLVEVEAVLNLRPLTYVYNENEEPLPLTPAHFLNFGQTEPTYPVSFSEIIVGGSKRSSLLKRKKYQVLLLKQIWSKWKQQYLLDLKSAHSMKNPDAKVGLKVGDVVLIEDNTKNKLLWKLGRVVKAIPGRDKKIRSYELKTVHGTLKRTSPHVYPLEI